MSGKPEAEREEPAPEETYEGTPEELTAFKSGPARFDRKKVMVVLCGVFVVVILTGLVFSPGKKKRQTEGESGYAARAPSEFLRRELDKSLRTPEEGGTEFAEGAERIEGEETGSALPAAVPVTYGEGGRIVETGRAVEPGRNPGVPYEVQPGRSPGVPYEVQPGRQAVPPPPPRSGGGGGGGGGGPAFTANFSSLVPPVIEGSLFPAQSGGGPAGTYAEQFPYAAGQPVPDYLQRTAAPVPAPPGDAFAAQNNQSDKQAFYGSKTGGLGGLFLGDDLVWIGTILPAVLETSINTDLPGNVLARVSQNVYDSRTGKKLLIPQGSILVARYNSSVSYAQHRIQIVWDLLIRPDGYMLELEGMNGVDAKGMSGAPAEYRENWFEYLKAAGIITMFTLANSKMAEEAARYGSQDMAAGVAAGNAEFINQIGGNIVSRAMNVQPTLVLRNGEKINVMINKNVYLPPVEDIPVTQKYSLR